MEFGPFGLTEILFIGGLALVVFGPRRLPEIGAAAGRSVVKLRRAMSEWRHAYEAELDESTRRSIEDARRDIGDVGRTLDAAGREIWQGASSARDLARTPPAPGPAPPGPLADAPPTKGPE
jgi:TatA/E family protein of Tat protein translocase